MLSDPKFSGFDNRGQPFAIFYTSKGVKWLRGDEAEPFASGTDSPAPVPFSPSLPSSHVGAAAQLAEAASNVGMWWEVRQSRLLESAAFEEERRIPWTMDMMERWMAVHRDGRHLDLRVSSFLARETQLTMEALATNKKMAVPQSMLYDLETMRDSLSAARVLLQNQFEELYSSPIDLGLELDMSFIRRLGEDPAEEWDRCLATSSIPTFAKDLESVMVDRDSFVNRLFVNSSPEIPSVVTVSVLGRLASHLSTFSDLASTVLEPMRSANSARRAEYRELALFSAEVVRARALHSAWGVVEGLVIDRFGTGLVSVEINGTLTLRAAEKPLDALSASRLVRPAITSSVDG